MGALIEAPEQRGVVHDVPDAVLHFLEGDMLAVSCLAVAPALAGMLLGQRLRGRLSEKAFRRALFSGLLLVAVHLIWKGVA